MILVELLEECGVQWVTADRDARRALAGD